MDLSNFFLFILYKQIEELHYSIGQASKKIEKRGALNFVNGTQLPLQS